MEYELGKCLPTYWLVEMICEILNIQSVKKNKVLVFCKNTFKILGRKLKTMFIGGNVSDTYFFWCGSALLHTNNRKRFFEKWYTNNCIFS